MPYPGRRARIASRISKGSLFVLLTLLSIITATPLNLGAASPSSNAAGSSNPPPASSLGLQLPVGVGADPVPDLRLPETVSSSVDSLIGAGGLLQASPDNLTLYNLAVTLRLLGGPLPHDELLSQDHRVLSQWSFWSVEVLTPVAWVPLLPQSNTFTLLGTNRTGTSVVRTLQVSTGPYSGTLRIVYRATSAGPLRWDPEFVPASSGRYRMVFSWMNITGMTETPVASGQFTAFYGAVNYTFSWTDVPASFNTTMSMSLGQFALSIDLGALTSGSNVQIDPSIVSDTTSPNATANTFQRKVFFEPKTGQYFAFYYDGYGIGYRSSQNSTTWSPEQFMPSGWPVYHDAATSSPSLYNSGQTVVVVSGDRMTTSKTCSPTPCVVNVPMTINLTYSIGNVVGPSISWQPDSSGHLVRIADSQTVTCGGQTSSCSMTLGIRYVSVTESSNGLLAFSYNAFANGTGTGLCGYGNPFAQTSLILKYNGADLWRFCVTVTGSSQMRSVVMPASSQGLMRIVYQCYGCIVSEATLVLLSITIDGNGNPGYAQLVEPSVPDDDQFSAVSDTNYGIHLLYRGPNGNVSYAYLPATTGASWAHFRNVLSPVPNVFSISMSYPTITVDYSTNDVYAFAIYGSSVAMRRKTLSGSWLDNDVVFPVTGRVSPTSLSSNLASAGATNSSQILLLWTENSGSPFNVVFASIPIQTAWSPYSFPADPWDGNGIAPYGLYFQNLGEYVSPSTGMLTVRQTDLSIPGRGLDFEITRVYAEPYSFLSGIPYYYENYPWAPIGKGWQLNIPWMNSISTPAAYIHLWNGQGYRIPSSFWNTPSSSFENHQGEHFRMIRNSTGIFLYDKSGAVYEFDPANLNRLTKIIDTLGNNIAFGYSNNNVISCITDSVQRNFLLSYSNGYLTTISQTTGSCAGGGTSIRQVQYSNNGGSLASVTDPAGRVTSYQYGAVGDSYVASWLLSRVIYPTGWSTNYTYAQALLGTQAYSYRVSRQLVVTSSSYPFWPGYPGYPVRQFEYGYTKGIGDQITGSTVYAYNATGIVPHPLALTGITDYSYSFAGVTWNSSDASHALIRGTQQRFGVNGAVSQEINLVTASNEWYWTTSDGNALSSPQNWFAYSDWHLAYAVANETQSLPPWGPINGWNDTSSKWIWANPTAATSGINGPIWFRTSFYQRNPTTAYVEIDADDTFALYIDGNNALAGTFSSNRYITSNFSLGSGYHWLTVYATNPSGPDPAGLLLSLHDSNTNQVLVRTDASLGSFTNYYSYDLWGNMIYSRRAVNPATNSYQESFSAYYTDGLAPAFDRFQEGFSMNNGNSPDNQWHVPDGSWTAQNGIYNGTGGNPVRSDGFAWSDIGVQDISLRAQVDPTQLVVTTATDPRVGLIAHYPGSGVNKWALVLHYANNNGWSLELLDDSPSIYPTSPGYLGNNQPSARAFCPINYGVWYTFTFAVHGNQANGTATFPGQTSPCKVTGTFASSSPAASGTGFGVYSNGFTALADNVTATTVDPFITSSTFSNSFIKNGGPGANVHAAIAGTADLQNGIGSSPIETYFSYWPWGGLNQTSRLYGANNTPWLTSSRTYDSYGNLATSTDARGNTAYFVYSGKYQNAYLTNETEILAPGSLVTRLYSYNFTIGTELSSIDPNGSNTTYQYDTLGRTRTVTYPNKLGSISYNYNDQVGYVNITNENGWRTRQIYDGLGQLTITQRFLQGNVYSNENYTYNWMNRVSTKTDPLGNLDQYQYDPLGRILSTTEPDGNMTLQTYSDLFGWVRYTDENGVYRCAISDRLGRLVSTVENASPTCQRGIVSNYYYDLSGNLLRVVDSKLESTSYVYDNVNRHIRTSYADGSVDTYAYDNNNNLIKKWDHVWVETLYAYDSLNRVKTISYCGNPSPSTVSSDSYSYDKNGNLLQLQSQNSTITYTYDARNRALSESYTVNSSHQIVDLGCYANTTTSSPGSGTTASYAVLYGYNGEVLNGVNYPDGLWANYTYDDIGRALTVFTPGKPPYATLTYNRNGQPTTITYGNGLVASYGYDKVSRPSQINLAIGPATLLSLNYQYYKTGTVSSVTGSNNGGSISERYNYDPLGRLTNSTVTAGTSNMTAWYEYDNMGNRIRQNINGIVTRYYYNMLNELTNSTASSNPGTTIKYYYDPNGVLSLRQITTGSTSNSWNYRYDVIGQLLAVTQNSLTVSTNAYDGLGRRLLSSEAGSATFYAYMGTETLYEKPSGLSVANDYVFVSGQRISKITGSATSYYHQDVLGSTRLVTDSKKNILFSDSYQPYGQDNGTPSGTETYKFTGKPYSQTTGLYYDYHRWYDPSVGRFTSPDPLRGYLSDPQSFNSYTYAGNTPTTFSDPTGAAYTGTTEICVDYCGEPSGVDFAFGAFALLGTGDLHYHLGGLGEDAGICLECENINRDIGPVDTTGADETNPSTTDNANAGGDSYSFVSRPEDLKVGEVNVIDIPNGAYEEARAAGFSGGQVENFARGNYADEYTQSFWESNGFQVEKTIPGTRLRPDATELGGIGETRPFRPGIDPYEAYANKINPYIVAYSRAYGLPPQVTWILYRYV